MTNKNVAISSEERLMRLALYLGLNNNSMHFHRVLNYLGSATEIFSGAWVDLSSLGINLSPLLMNSLVDLALEEIKKVENKNYSILVYGDENYPQRLLEVPQPPPVLWVSGEISQDDIYAISIVGPRKASSFGLQVAYNFAKEATLNGITVISGLAVGIDTQAHLGAIENGGRTLAVLGCGLDYIYPKENKKLYNIIPKCGALISEFPLGTFPLSGYFPRRNRVVAGLSLAVLVVEASERSGALITARLGLELNREVMAVPGRLDDKNAKGSNRLIKNGAALVENFSDVLNEIKPRLLEGLKKREINLSEKIDNINNVNIGSSFKEEKIENKRNNVNAEIPAGVSGLVFQVLLKESQKIDEIAKFLKLSIEEVAQSLLMLELDGKIVKKTSGFYEIVKG